MVAVALAAVDPERLVREELERRRGERFDAVLAVGKAAAGLARGVRILPRNLPGPPRRLLVRPHSSPALSDPGWECLSGGHPLPDRASFEAGARVRQWLSEAGPSLLALISGGASACLEDPAPGFSTEEVIETHRALLASGRDIHAVNTVRKRLSALKGGGALRAFRGERVLALLLSDVPGDDPSRIASGVGSGLFVAETEDTALAQVETVVIGSARTARSAAAAEARRLGFAVEEGDLKGEASRAGLDLVARGRSLPGTAVALVLAGETAVTLGDIRSQGGRGGRNTELALAAAGELARGEAVLALATDGEDAATGTAGAVVDGDTWKAVREAGIDPAAALARHDSLTALEAVPDALLRIGVTGTNVGDLAVYLRAERR